VNAFVYVYKEHLRENNVLTTFNEGAYLTFKSIFHKAFNLF